MKKPIKIIDLSVGYNKPILKNINLKIEEGQLIALIGRNGSGKSTLIKTLSGLLPELSGKFLFNNVNVLSLKELEKAKLISVVTTKPIDIYHITVFEYIAFGRYPHNNWLGKIKETDQLEIENAIEQCKISHIKNNLYENLSDGEKQRVNIAKAITQQTPLIILDEPSAHLDITNKVELFKLLNHLTRKCNKTIIFSTHQIEYALQVCNKIWVINNGLLLEETSTSLKNNSLLNEMIDSDNIEFNSKTNSFIIK